jgi:hypothetical protein
LDFFGLGLKMARNSSINVAGFDADCFAFGISNNSFLAHGMFSGLTPGLRTCERIQIVPPHKLFGPF